MQRIRKVSLIHGRNVFNLTWKALRSGQATEVCARGHTLAQILEAVEWRSKALLNNVDEQHIDEVAFLDATFEGSDNEEET